MTTGVQHHSSFLVSLPHFVLFQAQVCYTIGLYCPSKQNFLTLHYHLLNKKRYFCLYRILLQIPMFRQNFLSPQYISCVHVRGGGEYFFWQERLQSAASACFAYTFRKLAWRVRGRSTIWRWCHVLVLTSTKTPDLLYLTIGSSSEGTYLKKNV